MVNIPTMAEHPRTFDEAMELAYFGGQVLHPSAMVPCIEERIPVLVKCPGDALVMVVGGSIFGGFFWILGDFSMFEWIPRMMNLYRMSFCDILYIM